MYVYCLAGEEAMPQLKKCGTRVLTRSLNCKVELTPGKRPTKTGGHPSEPKMTLEQFNGALTSSRVVLVDVGATWCPPQNHGTYYRIHQEETRRKIPDGECGRGRDREILGHYAITQLPVFMIFKDGKLTWRRDGIATEEEITAELLK